MYVGLSVCTVYMMVSLETGGVHQIPGYWCCRWLVLGIEPEYFGKWPVLITAELTRQPFPQFFIPL